MKERSHFLALMSGVGMGWGSCVLVLKPELWISSVVLMGAALVLDWISTAEPKP